MNPDISVLVGLHIIRIDGAVGEEKMILTTNTGDRYQMTHYQDCCESVSIEDIAGDLADLLSPNSDNPILMAEESTNSEDPKPDGYSDSFTWTFYKFGTAKGYVTVRWLGESNGYYSESVEFEKLKP